MEERAVTSSISFNQFAPTVALQRSTAAARANVARAAAARIATPNRLGPVLAASSAARVSSTAAVLRAAAPVSQAAVTTPAAANSNISDVKNGPMAKAGQELINLYLDYQAFVDGGGQGTFRSARAPGLQVVGTSVRVDVKGATASALTSLGMKIEANHSGIIEGLLPIAQLPSAAQLSQVTMLKGIHTPVLDRM